MFYYTGLVPDTYCPNIDDAKRRNNRGLIMKKIGLICVTVLLCGSLAACGNYQKGNNKDSAKISSLKAENSSLKAKKHSHKHKKKTKITKSNDTTSHTAKDTHTNGNAGDPKEEQAAKAMRDYDPEWWDSLSPAEQQYWAHHTAYSSNEDFMYAPGLYEKHMIQDQPATPNSSSNNSYVPSNDDWHVYPATGYTPSIPTDN